MIACKLLVQKYINTLYNITQSKNHVILNTCLTFSSIDDLLQFHIIFHQKYLLI